MGWRRTETAGSRTVPEDGGRDHCLASETHGDQKGFRVKVDEGVHHLHTARGVEADYGQLRRRHQLSESGDHRLGGTVGEKPRS